MQNNSNFVIKSSFFNTPTHHPPAIPNLLLAPPSVELSGAGASALKC